MKFKRINKIKNTGIFHNFNWNNLTCSEKCLDFKEINLIFGWNGTGKTTLSRIFRNFELGKICKKLSKYQNSEYEFELCDTESKLSQKNITERKNVRVFNKDFVEESIFQDLEEDGRSIVPIYYLGDRKIELKKERDERKEKWQELELINNDLLTKNKERDKFETKTAKQIKDVLLGIKEFQNYNKSDFIKSFESIKEIVLIKSLNALKTSGGVFDDNLMVVKNSEILQSWLSDVRIALANITPIYIENINEKVLKKVVTIQKSIEKLKTDYELSNWIQKGILIHKTRNKSRCEFCNQVLSLERLSDLEAHFSLEYSALADLIFEKIRELKNWKIKEVKKIPNEELKRIAKGTNQDLDILINFLEKKQKNLLTKYELPKEEKERIIASTSNGKLETEKLRVSFLGLAKKLEQSLIANVYEEYLQQIENVNALEMRKMEIENKILELSNKIEAEEKSFKDFKLPAKFINEDLELFLGHNELKFEDRQDEYGETFYEITRNSEIAYNLSEGEKTAISLIYFLRKIKESNFDISDGIIYIDDPISSMDSQFLYSAYSFIVASLEKEDGTMYAKQLFIATHNYDLFNLFKKKYKKKIEKEKCGLYMFKIKLSPENKRKSNIYELDLLLKKFDSDYHYLFHRLIEFEIASEKDKADLAIIYPYPNIARRVLEIFLSFKFPSKEEYREKIESAKGVEKKTRESVYRFTNINSHGTLREVAGFSSNILEPTAKDRVLDVLRFIKTVDLEHYNELRSLNKFIK